MKEYVIIFLLSFTGVEELKLKTNGLNCSEIATAWREVNTTYHSAVKNDSKLQGNYTPDGKLMIGHLCQ